jgi:hypothetical protein
MMRLQFVGTFALIMLVVNVSGEGFTNVIRVFPLQIIAK